MIVEWCPKCNAQVPPGIEKCPRCGHKFRHTSSEEYSLRDIVWLSSTILGFILLPLLIIIGVVWLIFIR